MTVIGIDDTDSRELGMCTTYVASQLAAEVAASGAAVERTLLVRLNPAVEHKTRGNAALAIHTDMSPERAVSIARDKLTLAETGDERTNPGLVVAPGQPGAIDESVTAFAQQAMQDYCTREEAHSICRAAEFHTETRGNGRGLIGALAAVGAWTAFDSWTYECISYREPDRWGTERTVDRESVRRAADEYYPSVWDTIDRVENVAVCVPRTPCPILYGIRGDDPDAVRAVSDAIESEPVAHRRLFHTNQGTDSHLQSAALQSVENGYSYRVDVTVDTEPTTRAGGHVFFTITDGENTCQAAAFEPTKRFRDHVRKLRVGDEITACGEVQDGTLKLEKFAVRNQVRTERVNPACPDCGRSMKSAGRNAGYRCRACKTSADNKAEKAIERTLEPGWYEVPPCARRHIAKPLIRGGFNAPVHPER